MIKERVLNWKNLDEVAEIANLDPIPLRAEYARSLGPESDGYLVVQYDTTSTTPGAVIKRSE